MKDLEELQSLYQNIKGNIEKRINEFNEIKEGANNKELLKELVFCLMTPQSKAKTCAAVTDSLFLNDTIFNLSKQELSNIIKNVRFRNNKARYIYEAVKKFKDIDIKKKISGFKDAYKARKWLVENVNGYGYKEASHFLRNIGFGYSLSILDRHILKNLFEYGVINEIPKSMTPKKYIEIEKKMQHFAKDTNITLHHLDFVLWYKETKEVFK